MDYFRFLKEQQEQKKLKEEKRLKAQEERKLKKEKKKNKNQAKKNITKILGFAAQLIIAAVLVLIVIYSIF